MIYNLGFVCNIKGRRKSHLLGAYFWSWINLRRYFACKPTGDQSGLMCNRLKLHKLSKCFIFGVPLGFYLVFQFSVNWDACSWGNFQCGHFSPKSENSADKQHGHPCPNGECFRSLCSVFLTLIIPSEVLFRSSSSSKVASETGEGMGQGLCGGGVTLLLLTRLIWQPQCLSSQEGLREEKL